MPAHAWQGTSLRPCPFSYDTRLMQPRDEGFRYSENRACLQMPPHGMPGPPGGFPGRPGGPPNFPGAQRPSGHPMSQPQQVPGIVSLVLANPSYAIIHLSLISVSMSKGAAVPCVLDQGHARRLMSAEVAVCCILSNEFFLCRAASASAAHWLACTWRSSFFPVSTRRCRASKCCAMACASRYITAYASMWAVLHMPHLKLVCLGLGRLWVTYIIGA